MKYLEYEELLENEYIDFFEDGDDESDAGGSPEPEDTSTPDENEESPETATMSQSARESAMNVVSKALKQHAKKLSLAGPLGTVLLWLFGALVALIIIIGIIMFLITMPGMVMEKLKTLSREIGNAFASFFGGDATYAVTDENIYETLNYLEQMQYDLKTMGFLTDYVGLGYDDDGDGEIDEIGEDEDKDGKEDGVVRDADGKITNAMSDFIFNYLVSENYIYTIANSNSGIWERGEANPLDIIKGTLAKLADIITLGQAHEIWDRGFIQIHKDEGTLGKQGAYYTNNIFSGDKITLDPEAKTLEIRRGYFNNPMTYNLDGWTGRYGMPIDFLLAIHATTNMPDLAYDMATTFETRLLMLLHPLDNTATGLYKTDSGVYASYENFESFASIKKLDGINKKEAKLIMKEYGIESPSTCIGLEGYGEDIIVPDGGTSDTALQTTTIDFKSAATAQEINNKKQQTVEAYNQMGNILKSYGLTSATAGIPLYVDSFEQFKNVMKKLERKENYTEERNTYPPTIVEYVIEYYDDSRELNLDLTWLDSTHDDYEAYRATIKLRYDNYHEITTETETAGSGYSLVRSNKVYCAQISYNLVGEWSDKKVENFLETNNITVSDDKKCTAEANDDKEEVCVVCRKYIRDIYSELKLVNDKRFDMYQPYISHVTNHWFRDVYFVDDSYFIQTNYYDHDRTYIGNEFVSTDYEYESIMKERWTLYETDSNGDYVLYEIDENGEYKDVYNGTLEEAEADDEIKVAKKAVTTSISTNFEDIGWESHRYEEKIDGDRTKVYDIYAAYAIDDQTQIQFQKVYTDLAEGSYRYDIKDKIYVELKIDGAVVQKGEGQRTATNPQIKKMFLQNSYFRYDGNPEKAEIITKLRKYIAAKNVDSIPDYEGYGPLSDEELKLVLKEGDTEYKVSDYAGQVMLEQDSLNAFSILENTHTLDADYIYRDFKELVVELGYYSKEDLTDEKPRILQFLIPEIGSGGYPDRTIDKRENEFGTMIHSKYDIDANKKYALKELAKSAYLAEPPEDEFEDEIGVTTKNVETKEFLDNKNFFITYASLSATPMANFASVGAIQDIPETKYDVELVSGAAGKGVKKADVTVNGVKYEVWSQTASTCTLYSFAFIANAYTGEDFYNYVKATYGTSNNLVNQTGTGQGGNDYWQQGAGFKGKDVLDAATGGGQRYEPGTPNIGEKVAEALGKGIPVYFYGRYLASGNNHAIVLLGKADNGVLFYNPGGGYIGVCDEFGGSFESNLQKLVSSTYFNHWIYIPDVAPEGANVSGSLATYNGFLGNEAVVSPVTGVLLEYGTYEDEDEDRVNVDLKNGTSIFSNATILEDGAEEGNQGNTGEGADGSNNQNSSSENSKRIVKDKVGYAKILVLDKENYEKLETAMLRGYDGLFTKKDEDNRKYYEDDQGFLSDNETFVKNAIDTEAELEKIRDEDNPNTYLEETLYGYKEFAELYDTYGISGNIVYIDGFKCELPDEDFERNQDMVAEEIPNGTALKLEDFKVGINKLDNPGEKIQTLYEQAEEYKTASKKETERLNVEEEIKAGASPAVTVNGIYFIKEGTVLGRTYTDKEVITELRNEEISDYVVSTISEDAETEGEEVINENKLIGNYIRIMLKKEDEIIEDVESYMKLDDGTSASGQIDWEFYYWLPYESGGIGNQEPGVYTGAGACDTISGPGEIAVGFAQWTTLEGEGNTNNIAPLCKWLAEEDPSLCASLTTFGSYGNDRLCNDFASLRTAWYGVYDSNPKKFLELQMKYFYEYEYLPWLEADGVEWMSSKSMVLQGTYASLNNWAPNYDWQGEIGESRADEENIRSLLKMATKYKSTMGSLNDRWTSQYVLAIDILSGAFTDVETWVRTKQPSKYGEGNNTNSLGLVFNNNVLYADIRKKIYN